MKLIGIILAALCACCVGLIKAREAKKELVFVDNLLDLMKYIKNNIEYFNMPLYDIYNQYTPKKEDFITFVDRIKSDGWDKTIQNKDYNYISPSLKRLVKEYGSNLGNSNKEDQLRHNGFYIGELSKLFDEYSKNTPKKIKVYISLGIYAGILIIILFI